MKAKACVGIVAIVAVALYLYAGYGTGRNGMFDSQVTSNGRNVVDQYVGGVQVSTPAACINCPMLLMAPREYAITITSAVAINYDGTSTALQIEQRTSPGTSGTNLWTGAVTTSSTSIKGGTFNDNTVPANTWLFAITSAESGGVKMTYIYYRFTKD